MSLSIPTARLRPSAVARYDVMVVDDSAVIRGLITRILESDPEIKVAASVGNGQMALASLARNPVDVIVLDIEMPGMDGLTALPKLLALVPDVKIIMASTLTTRNAEISIKALSAGAADYVPKPTSAAAINSTENFRRELITKVKALASARAQANPQRRRPVGVFESPAPAAVRPRQQPVALRAPSRVPPRLIAIGSSTGGPQALAEVLSALPSALRQPIILTQHMPPTFTKILAEHLGRAGHRQAAEAQDGEILQPGRIYVAPGDFHLLVAQKDDRAVLRLTRDAPENFCRPAVDPMFRSAAAVFGSATLGIVLTGMGADGAKGAVAIADAGGTIIAQDEASSVVWGMPGATAAAGACSAVLPLKDVAGMIARLAGAGGRA